MWSSSKTRTRKHEPETTHLWGGALCLDFANSVDWTSGDEPLTPESDVLRDEEDVRRWGRRLGLFGVRAPTIDATELAAIHALRVAVHRSFAAVARDLKPAAADLDRVRGDFAEATAAGRLAAHDGAWQLSWPAGEPRRLRFAVAADAVGLLGSAERVGRVKRCPGRGCGWLFLDQSGRRRWCSMQTCGSRAKMRRLYARRRGGR
jgi:predicted RNA-binding Zn ribbon-like protein